MKQANSCFHAWLMVVLGNPFKFVHESVWGKSKAAKKLVL